MQVNVLQENLRSALSIVTKAVSNRATLPILGCVLIKADSTGMEISATDLYMGMKTAVAAVTDTPGKTAVPARIFMEAVTSLPAGKLVLELSESTLSITSQDSQLKVPCMNGDEFPTFPEVVNSPLETTTAVWQQIMSDVGFAVGTDPNRLTLSAILMEPTELGVKMVATDGFRLAVTTLSDKSFGGVEKLLIPARAVSEIVKIATQSKQDTILLMVDAAQKQLLFAVGSTQVFVRLAEGEYPPYQKIMPAQFELEASWDTGAFVEHLKRALIFGRESSYVVKMKIEQSRLTIVSRGATAGEYTGHLPIKLIKGESGQIAFNARYVLDLLNNVPTDQVWFGMSDSLKPALFRPIARPEYAYVVMPFRTND